jgi:hypothetical protein
VFNGNIVGFRDGVCGGFDFAHQATQLGSSIQNTVHLFRCASWCIIQCVFDVVRARTYLVCLLDLGRNWGIGLLPIQPTPLSFASETLNQIILKEAVLCDGFFIASMPTFAIDGKVFNT